jgi:hypothetical protein
LLHSFFLFVFYRWPNSQSALFPTGLFTTELFFLLLLLLRPFSFFFSFCLIEDVLLASTRSKGKKRKKRERLVHFGMCRPHKNTAKRPLPPHRLFRCPRPSCERLRERPDGPSRLSLSLSLSPLRQHFVGPGIFYLNCKYHHPNIKSPPPSFLFFFFLRRYLLNTIAST